MGRYSGKTCRLSIMLSLTFSFFLVEIVFGYITNSMALVADSFHMLSDVVALIIAFFCMKISKRRSSSKNTFGWVRAEVLGAMINAVFLIALCFSIFIEALKRLIEPEPIHDPLKILIVGVLGLVVNVIGIFMFHGHASVHGHSHARPVPLNLPLNGSNGVSSHAVDDKDLHHASAQRSYLNGRVTSEEVTMIANENGCETPDDMENDDQAVADQVSATVVSEAHNISFFNTANSSQKRLSHEAQHGKNETSQTKRKLPGAGQLNMHGVFLHILGDAFGSVIVIVNAVICWQVDSESLQHYLDPSLSLVMAIIIFSTTLPLLKESALILLQTVPTHIDVEDIKRKLLKSIDGVLAVHEFHVWRLAGNKIIATAHIRCRNLDEYMKIAENVKQLFHDEGIHSTTIQPEFDEVSAPNSEHCVLECPREAACAPSMCCSGSSASPATLLSDVTTVPEKSVELGRPSTNPVSDSVCTSQDASTAGKSPAEVPPPSQSIQSDPSTTNSLEESYKGVPPILYYNIYTFCTMYLVMENGLRRRVTTPSSK